MDGIVVTTVCALTCIIHKNPIQTVESLQYQSIDEFCPNYSL